MNLNFLYTTTSAVNAATSMMLGLFILLRNPRSQLNQLWWWMSLAIAVWAISKPVNDRGRGDYTTTHQ